MTVTFQWLPDLTGAEWLLPMNNEPLGSMFSIVPRGFEAYVRIFHPIERDRPRATGSWASINQETYFDGVDDIDALLETEPASWQNAADSFGTQLHAEAQFRNLVRSHEDLAGAMIAPDGWRYLEPAEGHVPASTLATTSAVLARHTSTPRDGVAAIWEGWDGLTSAAGFARYKEPSFLDGLRSRLQWLRKSKPGSGVLSREIAKGPRLELPPDAGRDYILFEAGVEAFVDLVWQERATWSNGVSSPNSPSMLWPEDHAWFFATDIDHDSTLVAGSFELAQELLTADGIEGRVLRLDAELSEHGDRINPSTG